MGRRDSGHERRDNDLYETPAWVVDALTPHLPVISCGYVWEPAAGTGKVMRALARHVDVDIIGSDIIAHHPELILFADFLAATSGPMVDEPLAGIITNPPYTKAQEFIEKALALTAKDNGFVAMLLPSDFDTASSRRHLFADCPQFAKEVTLTKRIRWFDDPVRCIHCQGAGKDNRDEPCKPCRGRGWRKPSPSENHKWFLWDHVHGGSPTKAYAP